MSYVKRVTFITCKYPFNTAFQSIIFSNSGRIDIYVWICISFSLICWCRHISGDFEREWYFLTVYWKFCETNISAVYSEQGEHRTCDEECEGKERFVYFVIMYFHTSSD